MTRKDYFATCMEVARQDPRWLVLSVENPSPGMRPIHIRLQKLALRKVGAAYVKENEHVR